MVKTARPEDIVACLQHRAPDVAFASPIVWQNTSRHCVAAGVRLDSVKTLLTVGAPIPAYLHRRFQELLPAGAQVWTRSITRPVAGSVTVALNGTPQASGWSVSTATGLVTFTTAPAAGLAVTAGFEFDVPVRFDTDTLDVTLDLERLGSITSIPLLEIRD